MKELSLKEQHKMLLDISKAFDKVCRDNNIPYYMLGGTMLGAIRHKGFIPWDDDMDFGVPREHYDRLENLLREHLPPRYRCCTYQNSKNVVYPYFKIEDTKTKSNSGQYVGTLEDALGINIDVFPLDSCDKDDPMIKKVIRMADKYGRIYTNSATNSLWKNIAKKIIRVMMPISQDRYYAMIENTISSIRNGKYLANLFGHWEEKEIVPTDWYGEYTMYAFEDIELCGFKEYDKYLSQLYGNYMQLPPENKRQCHSNGVYLLD